MFNHVHTQRIAAKDLDRLLDATDTVNKIIFQNDKSIGVAVAITKRDSEHIHCSVFYNEMAHVCSLFYYFGAKVAEAEKESGK
jgi:hypothetical protein